MLCLFLRCSLTVVAMLMTSVLIWCHVKSYVTNWRSHDFFRNRKPGRLMLTDIGYLAQSVVYEWHLVNVIDTVPISSSSTPSVSSVCIVLFQLLFVGRIFRGSIIPMNSFAGILTLTFTQYQTVCNSHRHKYPQQRCIHMLMAAGYTQVIKRTSNNYKFKMLTGRERWLLGL